MAKKDNVIPKKAIDDILAADEAISKLDDSTLAFEKRMDSLIKTMNKMGISYDDLKKTQKKSKDETKNLADEEKKLQAIEDGLKRTTDDIVKAKIVANQKLKEQRERVQDLVNAENKELGTEEKLLIANQKLRKERKKLNTETEEGLKRQTEINEELDKNNDLIKENSDKFKQNRMSVGGYKEGIEEALASTDKFSGGTTNVINNFVEMSQQEGGLKSFFSTFIGGMKSATKAGLKFIMTPIGAIIFAIVAAIGLFTAAIKRNEGASDMFSKIWSGITNVIDEVIGRVFRLAGAIGKLLKGDFRGALKAGKEAFTGFGKAMKAAFDEGVKLKELQIELEEQTIKATVSQEKLNTELERLAIITGDSTKSFKVREAAAEEARKKEELFAATAIKLAKIELDIKDMQVEKAIRQGTINRALRQEQAEALQKMVAAEGALTIAIAGNEKERAELKQDRLEKDLDILIDGFDNIKAINERIIADDRKTVEERQKVLDDTTNLFDASFAKQVETVKKFTKVNFDENALIAEQDAIALNEKIRGLGLSEIMEGRLLEVIRDRRTGIQDLAEAQRDIDNATAERTKAQIEKDAITFQMAAEKRIADMELLAKAELILLKQKLIDGELTEEEFANRSEEIVFRNGQKIINAELDIIDKQLANAELGAEVRAELMMRSSDLRKELITEEADFEISEMERVAERRREITDAAVQLGIDAGNAVFAHKQQQFEEELTKLQEQKDAELLAAGDDAEKKEKINEKFRKKEAEVKRKQAETEKKQALFNIAVNTAVAITRASPIIPLMIFAAVTGALQAALVASKPIPKFGKGTKSAPKGLLEIAEAGRELAHKKTGELMMFSDRAVTSGLEGATIYTNKETEAIMAGKGGGFDSPDIKALMESNERVARALENQPIYHFETSKRQITERRGNNEETYINVKVLGL